MVRITVQNNARQLKSLLKRKAQQGLAQTAAAHAALYHMEVTKHQTKPRGSWKQAGQLDQGQIVYKSRPGQYPFREYGTGAKNIRWALDRVRLVARSGVREEGLHLYFLSHFSHPWAGPFERLGMDQVLATYLSQLQQAFVEGCRSVSS